MSRAGEATTRNHWAVDADGAHSAALLDCLQAATAAPSIHNTQPWRFRIQHASIDVLADRSRLLRVVDPQARELMISLGAAILNLRLAMLAHGRLPLLRLLPERTEPDLVARVTAGQSVEPRPTVRALANAIPLRHTNRFPFANRPVPDSVLAELSAAAAAEGAQLGVAGPVGRDAILMLTDSAERTQCADKRYHEELSRWACCGPSRLDGIPWQAIGPRDRARRKLPLRDFTPTQPVEPEHTATFEPHPVIVTLSTVIDSEAEWLRTGQALERILLTATVRGLAVTPMSAPTEVTEVRRLLGDPRQRRMVQLVLRLGYGPAGVGSPRRPLAEMLD
jgi:nitroreductase